MPTKKKTPLKKVEMMVLTIADKSGLILHTEEIHGLSGLPPRILQDSVLLLTNHLGLSAWTKSDVLKEGYEKLNKDEKNLVTTMMNGGEKKIKDLLKKYSKGKKKTKKAGGKNGKK